MSLNRPNPRYLSHSSVRAKVKSLEWMASSGVPMASGKRVLAVGSWGESKKENQIQMFQVQESATSLSAQHSKRQVGTGAAASSLSVSAEEAANSAQAQEILRQPALASTPHEGDVTNIKVSMKSHMGVICTTVLCVWLSSCLAPFAPLVFCCPCVSTLTCLPFQLFFFLFSHML
jgi:hypothetical protein